MNNKISLPIDPYLNEITDKILSNQPVILNASPGSGKTTRVPVDLLFKLRRTKNNKKIIVIVPKRISALSAASRVCDENNFYLGADVGYSVRFDSKISNDTQLIFMTDGLFLKKYTDLNFIKDIGYIFLDEFHERKSNMDLILGICMEQKIFHNTIQIIVMSATMNIKSLEAFFSQSHVIEIKAPPFIIIKNYLSTSQRLMCDSLFYEQLKITTLQAWKETKKDILVFLPGLREITKAIEIIRPALPQVALDVLHGSLTLENQKNVVAKSYNERRIIFSTNIAESSITLPDLDCVIDSGLEKSIVSEKKIGFTKLKTERISLFSATQREGRAARTNNGYCYKLWHSIDERSMQNEIKPEILESNLLQEILFLSSIDVIDVINFSWLDKPPINQIDISLSNLKKWNLIDAANKITLLGKIVSDSPIDIFNSILFIELLKLYSPEYSANLICRFENLDNLNIHNNSKNAADNDIQRLMETPLTPVQIYLKKSLLAFSAAVLKKLDIHVDISDNNISYNLFKIYSQYFPYRIIAKKTGLQGLSSLGRGVELSNESSCKNFDFYACLAGFEKNDATTLITYGAGVSKAEALKILTLNSTYKNNVYFEEKTEIFFKQESLYFGSFKLNEKSKKRLNQSELNQMWKSYVNDSPESFLSLNFSYQKNKNLILFLQTKQKDLNLKDEYFLFLNDFDNKLIKKMSIHLSSFDDFKNADIYYYLNEIVPDELHELIGALPKNIKLPSGKMIDVIYTDPKSPLISARIQDFFGWNETPKILNDRLKLTLELLAPNYRPAQTTSDLGYFWKNSYIDVRKDFRARYPKHSWPEDPTKL